MTISLMVMTDDGKQFAAMQASFDEKQGFHRRDLRKLYLNVRRELALKQKKLKELEVKDGKRVD